MSDRIGFIGLGVMGKPMALNLLGAERDVVAYTRAREVLDDVVSCGAEAAASPREVAAAADVIITMLPDGAAARDVALGDEGVLAGARPGSLFVDMSTIAPSLSKLLADEARTRNVAVLDAPVSGGDVGAREGTLSIMVGGDIAAFERALPIFEILGRRIVHVGPHGAGQIVKACNQIVVGIIYAALGEALTLGSKSGVEPEALLDVLAGGLAANRIIEVRRRNFLEHDFTPGFRSDLHHKDLNIALAVAAEERVALPVTALVQQMFNTLRAAGRGGDDHSAILTVVEEAARHRIGDVLERERG